MSDYKPGISTNVSYNNRYTRDARVLARAIAITGRDPRGKSETTDALEDSLIRIMVEFASDEAMRHLSEHEQRQEQEDHG